MKNTLNSSDNELVLASRSGDQAAFGRLVTRYQSLICSVAYNRCGDIASSEDLAQEAFIQAWNKLSDLEEVANFKSWLCTIVRNLASRSYTRQSKKPISNAASLDNVAEVAKEDVDPVASVMEAEQQQLVWNALSQIPEKYREPMILFYREDQSIGRVAEALDLTTDATKQRLSRGRKMLHAQMVATVEKTLGESKPTENFASTVLAGLGGAGKAAVAGGASKAGWLLSGSSSMFWLSQAQLPLVVWLARIAVKDARSDAERALVIRHLILNSLALIPMIGLMTAYVYFQPPLPRPLRGLGIPTIMILCLIPIILNARRVGKRIEALRMKEGTATPKGQSHEYSNGTLTGLFLGSGILIALGTMLVPIYVGQWTQALCMLGAGCTLSVLARFFVGNTTRRGVATYTIGMGMVALCCLWISYNCVVEWREILGMDHSSFWFLAGLQIQGATLVILLTVVRRKVFRES